MARVKNPLMSQEAHGTVGGIEFRLNRSGSVVGRRSIATPTRGTAHDFFAARMGRARTVYATLSTKLKTAWERLDYDLNNPTSRYQLAYSRTQLVGAILNTFDPGTTRNGNAKNVLASWVSAPTWVAKITWTPSGTLYNRLFVYIAPSYRNLTNPPKRAFKFWSWQFSTFNTLTLPALPRTPHVWIRVDLVSATNARTMKSWYLKLHNPP